MAMMAMGLGGDMTGYGLVGGGLRPSYFELFMQEFISSLLRPAMQHTVAALAPRIPLLYRASNWHDEIFTVILGLLEWTHLRTKGAPRAAPAPAPAPAPLAPASSSAAPLLLPSEGLTRRRAAADAGFAESFFDLKRARYFPPSTNGVKPPPSYMRTSDQWACMLCLVGVPYLKVKIESWVARQGGGVRAALSSPALFGADRRAVVRAAGRGCRPRVRR